MLLADLAETTRAVAATSARTAKVSLIASLLARVEPDEAPIATGILSGVPRQGRIGIGWATLKAVDVVGAGEPSLTLRDLDEALDRIVATTGSGSAERRAAILAELFSRATPAEAELIRRVLLGDMAQGALGALVADAAAKAAGVPVEAFRRALMLSGDLGATTAVALRDGVAGLQAVGLEVFRPVLPMLASTSESVASAIEATGEASVEWKLDGVRIQAHRSGGDVRLYTRNLNDVTARLPAVVELVRSLPVRDAVLDGEAMPMAAFFFDVLHVDGEDLIDRPLRERLDALARIAPGCRIPSTVTGDAREAQRVLDEALAAGHEGVMMKDLSSPYQAGRRGRAWRKVKPVRTFDLVVLGAEWGSGRRRGWLSNLHLGARDAATGGFVMVGKTFKGMTDEMLRWQTERLLALERERSGIEVLVRPELVVEIELEGVQASTRYEGGITLRFARVVRYRDDKTPADADTLEDLRALLPRGEG